MFSKSFKVGAHSFSRKIVGYETIREVGGFQRRVWVRRVDHRIDGVPCTKEVWLATISALAQVEA